MDIKDTWKEYHDIFIQLEQRRQAIDKESKEILETIL